MEVLSAQAADTIGGGKVSQDALKPLWKQAWLVLPERQSVPGVACVTEPVQSGDGAPLFTEENISFRQHVCNV